MKIFHTVRPAWVHLVLVLWVQPGWAPAETRFHHLHLNAPDPATVHEFLAPRFPTGDWLKVERAELVEVKTAFWHLGWGVQDFRSAYIRLLDLGTRFEQPAERLTPRVDYAYAAGPHGLLVEINTAPQDGFGHVHLWSAHPVVAGEWYQRLGLRPTRPLVEQPVSVGRYTLTSAASLECAGFALLIYPRPAGVTAFAPTAGTLVDHLAFQVDNLERKLLELRRSGTRVLEMPHDRAPGLRAAMVQGPDGVRVELVEAR